MIIAISRRENRMEESLTGKSAGEQTTPVAPPNQYTILTPKVCCLSTETLAQLGALVSLSFRFWILESLY